MRLSDGVKTKLESVMRDSKKEIIGTNDINNDAHAEVLIGIIKAFGDNPCGFIYNEANLPYNTYKPADIILCDLNTGVIVIEVKGYNINMINRIIKGNTFFIEKNGIIKEISPWNQARNVMFEIEDKYKRIFVDTEAPWFSYMVALPNIREDEWKNKFGKESIAFNEVIFSNDLQNISVLKNKIMDRRIPPKTKFRINNPIDVERIKNLRKIFGDSAVINKKREVRHIEESCHGDKIDKLENMFKNLTEEQQELSDLMVDGRPRLIRGVAGSGKTVILANMIATYIKKLKRDGKQSELDFDDTKIYGTNIAVICFNKTLIHFLKEKIELSYKSQTGEELKWDEFILVKNFDSFVYKILVNKGIIGENIMEIGDTNDRSKFLSKEWEEYKKNNINWDKVMKFDAIFVDEGQDLSEEQYGLLKDLLKTSDRDEKNIIIFYDDAQNIYGRKRPNWSNIGINVIGDRTKVMKECLRNTKQIINLAYNVLLGSCSNDNIRVNTREFADVNYLKKIGLILDNGDWVYVRFAQRNGPEPVIKKFNDEESELNWITESVKELIEKEKVRPEDILIMTYPQKYCEKIAHKLENQIAGVDKIIHVYKEDERNRYIFEKNCLTISTIHGAKGYDASVVFLVGLHFISADNMPGYEEDSKNIYEVMSRAVFYVGATRAKYLLYLSGINNNSDSILEEIEKTHILLKGKNIYKNENEDLDIEQS